MPSTFTTNLNIEKIADGEQVGTWGATTNGNWDLVDTEIFARGRLGTAETVTATWDFTNVTAGLKTDTIAESTLDAGVTIDGVLIKDGLVDGVDVSAIDVSFDGLSGKTAGTGDYQTTGSFIANTALQSDTVSERTADAGVTVDGVALKDGGATFTGTVALDVADSLSFETGKHWITYNDGAGNFNIRIGHYDNVGGTEECTEAGYIMHMEWTQSTGVLGFNVSDATMAVGGLIGTNANWREQVNINPTDVQLRYQGSTVLATKSGGVTVTGDVGCTTITATGGGSITGGDFTVGTANGTNWIVQDCADGSTERAGWACGESGKFGAATMHQYYTGDGYFHIGMGTMTATTHAAYRAMYFFYQSANVWFTSSINVAGDVNITGNPKITNASPTLYQLDNSASAYSSFLHCNSNLWYVLNSAAGGTSWSSNGNGWPVTVTLSTSDTSFGRNISAGGNVTAYSSDRRLKKNIEEIPDALEKVSRLRGVTFDWREDKLAETTFNPAQMTDDVGLIAQEVQAVMPQAAPFAPFDRRPLLDENGQAQGETYSVSGEDYLTVDEKKLVPLLVQAIKELTARVEELEAAS